MILQQTCRAKYSLLKQAVLPHASASAYGDGYPVSNRTVAKRRTPLCAVWVCGGAGLYPSQIASIRADMPGALMAWLADWLAGWLAGLAGLAGLGRASLAGQPLHGGVASAVHVWLLFRFSRRQAVSKPHEIYQDQRPTVLTTPAAQKLEMRPQEAEQSVMLLRATTSSVNRRCYRAVKLQWAPGVHEFHHGHVLDVMRMFMGKSTVIC